ncbi:hypothetical protein D3C73_1305630 [compost metagenome]
MLLIIEHEARYFAFLVRFPVNQRFSVPCIGHLGGDRLVDRFGSNLLDTDLCQMKNGRLQMLLHITQALQYCQNEHQAENEPEPAPSARLLAPYGRTSSSLLPFTPARQAQKLPALRLSIP